MKTAIGIALLASNSWTATALPIHHYDINASDTVASPLHRTLDHTGSFPVITKFSSTKKHAPHFLEWLANEHSEHRDALRHATEARPSAHHRDGSSSVSKWSDRARKMINTWSVFYGTEYPTKPSSSAKPTSFDSGNDNSIATDPLIVGDACGVIVENSADGETSFTTIMCPPLQSPNTRPHRPGYFEQLRHNLATMDVAMICSRYGPELVALCIFLLVPISVVIVEIVDAVQDKMVIEKFPERGRGRIRLTEPERRMSVLAKCEREKMVRDHAQKSWVSSRRGSRHAST